MCSSFSINLRSDSLHDSIEIFLSSHELYRANEEGGVAKSNQAQNRRCRIRNPRQRKIRVVFGRGQSMAPSQSGAEGAFRDHRISVVVSE